VPLACSPCRELVLEDRRQPGPDVLAFLLAHLQAAAGAFGVPQLAEFDFRRLEQHARVRGKRGARLGVGQVDVLDFDLLQAVAAHHCVDVVLGGRPTGWPGQWPGRAGRLS
jgi:hypothetical protein